MKRGRFEPGCPIDCPRRRAIPNCHNEATCKIWAAYVAKHNSYREARSKRLAEEDDVSKVRARGGKF